MPESQTDTHQDSDETFVRHPRGRIAIPDLAEVLILAWAAIAAYWPALLGGVLWDDSAHLTGMALRSLGGLWRIWFQLGATPQYYPLLHTAFWMESHLWGNATVGYHLCNVLLHATSAYLVVRIVRRLELPGAWLAGFVFALHPVCVETVAWISEQKSALSGVFYLAAALAYLHFTDSRRRRTYWVAFGLFVLALLSKSVTATLPAVLLVILWWRKGRLDWQLDIRPLSGWLALGAGAGWFTAWVERTYVGAQGGEYALTPLQHLLLAGRVVWFYAAKLAWPVNLIFSYPRWTLDPRQGWQFLYPAGLIAVAAGFFVLARRRRGPLAAFLIYVGTLTPVLGFLNVYPFRYSYVADHFQYLASLAIIVPVCSWLTAAARRVSLPKQLAGALAAFLVVGLGAMSWRQAHDYTDGETLYRRIIARNPGSFMAFQNLCALLEDSNRLEEATGPCEEQLRLRPDMASAHVNMGVLRKLTGDMAGATAEWRTAMRLAPREPTAYFDLGNSLADQGRIAESLPEFQTATAINPYNPQYYLSYGAALRLTPGRERDALAAYQKALQIAPCYVDALFGAGLTEMQIPGRSLEAIEDFEAALRCRPDYEPARQMLAQLGPWR